MSTPSIVPSMEPTGPRVGEWVRVWGQVAEGNTHPDDALVEFFSHNEQYRAHVALERIEEGGRPAFALPCPALYLDKKGRYVRCESHHGHGGMHSIGAHTFDRPDVWIEDNS